MTSAAMLESLPVPTAAEIVGARTAAQLSQTAAAAMLGLTQNRWSEYERGLRNMPRSKWAVFLLLCDLHPALRIKPR